MREASITRRPPETDISLRLPRDGRGPFSTACGVGQWGSAGPSLALDWR